MTVNVRRPSIESVGEDDSSPDMKRRTRLIHRYWELYTWIPFAIDWIVNNKEQQFIHSIFGSVTFGSIMSVLLQYRTYDLGVSV